MLTEEQILSTLDNCFDGYCHFITLSHPYTYLIDSRINIFRSDDDKWAVVGEVLGFSPPSDMITLELTYFGNCLKNLEPVNNQSVNSITVYPVDWDSFRNTVEYENLKPGAEFWLVRGKQLKLSHNKQDYTNSGIELKEYEPGEISAEEVGRLLIVGHSKLFRATDEELYTCIPKDLKKLLVLDEWHHREYYQLPDVDTADLPDSRQLYNYYNDEIKEKIGLDIDAFSNLFANHIETSKRHNQQEWNENRPGAYETWQILAKVITTGDVAYYKPTLPPNNHWTNWPDSGSM